MLATRFPTHASSMCRTRPRKTSCGTGLAIQAGCSAPASWRPRGPMPTPSANARGDTGTSSNTNRNDSSSSVGGRDDGGVSGGSGGTGASFSPGPEAEQLYAEYLKQQQTATFWRFEGTQLSTAVLTELLVLIRDRGSTPTAPFSVDTAGHCSDGSVNQYMKVVSILQAAGMQQFLLTFDAAAATNLQQALSQLRAERMLGSRIFVKEPTQQALEVSVTTTGSRISLMEGTLQGLQDAVGQQRKQSSKLLDLLRDASATVDKARNTIKTVEGGVAQEVTRAVAAHFRGKVLSSCYTWAAELEEPWARDLDGLVIAAVWTWYGIIPRRELLIIFVECNLNLRNQEELEAAKKQLIFNVDRWYGLISILEGKTPLDLPTGGILDEQHAADIQKLQIGKHKGRKVALALGGSYMPDSIGKVSRYGTRVYRVDPDSGSVTAVNGVSR